ncbi:MAG: hypothetical protein QM715_17275 [Nibricoccus sp.]
MKGVSIASLVFAGLPLVIYPVVALADIMSLAGQSSGAESVMLSVVATTCQIGSLLYPAVYFLCLALYRKKMKQDEQKSAFWFSLTPMAVLLFLFAMFYLWSRVDHTAWAP